MRLSGLCFLSLFVLTGCHRAVRPESTDPRTERSLSHGKVVGFSAGKAVDGWLGIPYAAPPVGPLRWRAPQPLEAWEGVREAIQFGNPCVQFGGPMISRDEDGWGMPAGSEDCLVLDVYAPRFEKGAVPEGDERLPVMFWIHGGGNTMGSTWMYAGARNLAEKHGVVVVAVQYRLGPLGWFHHPALHDESASAEDRSGNFATLDLIHALEWVRENAPVFGGDPGNVTIFGESAGAMNVLSLLVAPKAAGLFHRAISQSGLPASASHEDAFNFRDDPVKGDPASSQELLLTLLQKEGRAKDRKEAKAKLSALSPAELSKFLRSRTPEQLLSHFDVTASSLGMYAAPYIFRDGVVLPKEPLLDALGDPGRVHRVPVILGSNRDEYKLFMLGKERFVSKFLGLIPQVRDPIEYERVASTVSRAWKVLGADLPAKQLTKIGVPVFTYRFDWDEGPKNFLVDLPLLLGAAHATELRPLFLEFDDEDPFRLSNEENEPGRREVGTAMASFWTHFAHTGAPAQGRDETLAVWKPAEEGTMLFDTTRDGGVRMARVEGQLETIVSDAFRDASEPALVRDRCELVAGMFQLLLISDSWSPADFPKVTGGRCDAFGYEALKPTEPF